MGFGIMTKFANCLWRRKNKNNFTTLGGVIDFSRIIVGKGTYGELFVLCRTQEPSRLIIGNYCSIAKGVTFLLGDEHPTKYISTYPFKTNIIKSQSREAISKGDIVIDDDVWIGYKATIMSGVHIRQGAVIASGAIVTHDVEAYSIVGGIPAKFIRKRFSQEIIDELLKVDFSKLDSVDIISHEADLYTEVQSVQQLKWLPKK